jgi:hypothetical protein
MAIVRSIPSTRVINGFQIATSDIAVVSEANYSTRGEEAIIIKGVPSCKLKLDSATTDHVKIKALTNVLILPDKNKIDEEWDEIYVESGACIEFRYAGNYWYIMSSDGLKLPD